MDKDTRPADLQAAFDRLHAAARRLICYRALGRDVEVSDWETLDKVVGETLPFCSGVMGLPASIQPEAPKGK